ncbi:MAG: hypothetical protein GY744_07835 [Gammaproteobacteria bacterium]|nr:hypothetical protein [Gammaproteobacteria bacterium]
MAGITNQDQYARWSAGQLMTCFGLFAKYGVQHIITHAIVPTQWEEVTPGYREKLIQWITGILSDPATISEYKRRGWRESFIGANTIPEFEKLQKTLSQEFPQKDYLLTIYYTATPSYNTPWTNLTPSLKTDWETQDDLIYTQYKEAIPPIKLYIGYGKPVMSSAVCPPLLAAFDGMHSYWLQKPGFLTDERSVLSVLYDYAHTRKTWISDKSERTEQVLNYRDEMLQDNILGIGKRLGPFWYPDNNQGKNHDQ